MGNGRTSRWEAWSEAASVFRRGSGRLWRSENRGHSWERISPDLTYGDPETLHGEQSLVRNQNSQDYYATLFAVAVFEMLSQQLETQLAQLATVIDDELPRFNEALCRARLDPIDVPTHRPD